LGEGLCDGGAKPEKASEICPAILTSPGKKAKVDGEQIKVRMAAADDASAVATVLERAFNEYRESYTHGGFIATYRHDRSLASR
jgi:hypothetical protein